MGGDFLRVRPGVSLRFPGKRLPEEKPFPNLQRRTRTMRKGSIRNQVVITMAAASLFAVGCKQATPPEAAKPVIPFAAAEPTDLGGQKIVKLERKPTSNGTKPEFLSATILPGRGMNLYQIKASIPGK